MRLGERVYSLCHFQHQLGYSLEPFHAASIDMNKDLPETLSTAREIRGRYLIGLNLSVSSEYCHSSDCFHSASSSCKSKFVFQAHVQKAVCRNFCFFPKKSLENVLNLSFKLSTYLDLSPSREMRKHSKTSEVAGLGPVNPE